jgi:hypothetical protein
MAAGLQTPDRPPSSDVRAQQDSAQPAQNFSAFHPEFEAMFHLDFPPQKLHTAPCPFLKAWSDPAGVWSDVFRPWSDFFFG